MAKAHMPLAQSKFNIKDVKFPALQFIKLDGVPVIMTVTVAGDGTPQGYTLKTRSGEPVLSAHTACDTWYNTNLRFFEGFAGTHTVIGECTQTVDKFAPFKDTGGIVRRQEDQGGALTWNIFDYCWDGGDVSYVDRWDYVTAHTLPTNNAAVLSAWVVNTADELYSLLTEVSRQYPKAEGMIVRNYDDTHVPNKRSKGYQKLVHEPMIDLWAVGVTEAVSQDGLPKNMVGGVVVSYKGELSKAGAGKLTHKERSALFQDTYKNEATVRRVGLGDKPNLVWYEFPEKLMGQFKHKVDDSYDALRQPTFQVWRPDKEEPDA